MRGRTVPGATVPPSGHRGRRDGDARTPPRSDSPSKIWAAHWIHHVPSASIPFVPVVNLGPGVGRSFFPPPHPAHIRPSPPPVLQNASHSPKN